MAGHGRAWQGMTGHGREVIVELKDTQLYLLPGECLFAQPLSKSLCYTDAVSHPCEDFLQAGRSECVLSCCETAACLNSTQFNQLDLAALLFSTSANSTTRQPWTQVGHPAPGASVAGLGDGGCFCEETLLKCMKSRRTTQAEGTVTPNAMSSNLSINISLVIPKTRYNRFRI